MLLKDSRIDFTKEVTEKTPVFYTPPTESSDIIIEYKSNERTVIFHGGQKCKTSLGNLTSQFVSEFSTIFRAVN